MNMSKCMFKERNISKLFLGEVVFVVVYILIKSSTKSLHDVTQEEKLQ